MLGLFKRKPKQLDDAAKARLSGLIADLLTVQLLILPNPTIEDAGGKVNMKALGYIYGYIDACLQTKGYDMADGHIGVPVTFHVLHKLFPKHSPDRYVRLLMDNMNDQNVALGMTTGGQQYFDFRKPGREGDVAMGLARLIMEGRAVSTASA
jgi:hypothetical protein